MARTLTRCDNKHYRNLVFLAEVNQWPEDVRDYFSEGDECHMAYNFPLMPRMYMAIAQEDRYPIVDITRQTPDIPESCQWANFLRNHDELTLEMVTDKERDYMYQMYADNTQARLNFGIRRRLAPLMDNENNKIRLMTINRSNLWHQVAFRTSQIYQPLILLWLCVLTHSQAQNIVPECNYQYWARQSINLRDQV
jgi:glycosidase